MSDVPRRVVWFSCGAASACAAKLTIQKDPSASVVYCDTSKSEHPDNKRFLTDVEKWIGKAVEIIRSDKYKTIEEVFEKRRYMSGPKGAICTAEMKKIPRFHFQRADDIHIFGFTFEEHKRVQEFKNGNPELRLEWPLREAGMEKDDCYRMLEKAGVKLPVMYSLGFRNNNCLGCVKATSPKYWNMVRQHFPEVFKRRATQSREIGCRLVRFKGERIFLDELLADKVEGEEENVSCGPECGQVAE